jgi:3-oxoacyl-[acyl-carrier protein] reductase
MGNNKGAVLVTGVSKGVGASIAKKLLKEDYLVYGISRSETEEVKELKESFAGQFFFKSVDLSDADAAYQSIFKAGDFLTSKVVLKGFVNNAAMAYDDIITNLNAKPLRKMYEVNVFAPMLLTKYVIRNFLLHKSLGSIVHISSVSVHTGYKGLSMYAGTKGALEAFSKNTAREWGARKIRSNCIVAGFMDTDMSAGLTADQKNRIYKRTSLKEPTNVETVANTVEFLLSDNTKTITGQNIFVDSGTI